MDSSLQLRAPARWGRRSGSRRLVWAACVLVVLALASGCLGGPVDLSLGGRGEVADLLVIAAAIAYVLAMALPFVPGIEIGLALMLVLGWDGILLVYFCTQIALVLSFGVGQCVPARAIAAAFRWLGRERTQRMVEELERTAPARRVELLARHSTTSWLGALLRHRHLALAWPSICPATLSWVAPAASA